MSKAITLGACAATLLVASLSFSTSVDARDVAILPPKPSACTDCGKENYGTTVHWAGTPAEAAKKALKEEKLVFVLHVSGHFEDAKFT
jgi:hypothetical protein